MRIMVARNKVMVEPGKESGELTIGTVLSAGRGGLLDNGRERDIGFGFQPDATKVLYKKGAGTPAEHDGKKVLLLGYEDIMGQVIPEPPPPPKVIANPKPTEVKKFDPANTAVV